MYLKKDVDDAGNHGNPQSNPFPGSVLLSDNLLSAYIQTMGFANITLDGDTVTDVTVNQVALDAYLEGHPVVSPPEPVPSPEERLASLEQENNLLRAQIQAASSQNDFLEECIVEMAGLVYG